MYHATSLQACGKSDEAVEVYGQILAQQPDHWLAMNNLGVVLDMAGNSGAEDVFRRVTTLAPDYAEGWNNLGRCLHRQGRSTEAVSAYRKALKLKPGHAAAAAGLEQLQSAGPQAADAGATLDSQLQRIAVLQRQGHAGEALVLLDQCRDRMPPVEWHVQRGQLLTNESKWEEAAENFKAALDLDATRWEALRGLGHALARSERFGELDAVARAQEAKGLLYEAAMLDGLAQVEQKNLAKAMEFFQTAADRNPAAIDGYFYLGVSALNLEDNAAAERAFRAVLAIDPAHGPSLNNLGNVLVSENRQSEAVEVLQQARKKYPDDVVLLNTLGLALTRLGRFDEAEPILKAAVTINKNFAEGWSNLAKAKLDASRPDEAVPLLEQAVSIRPDYHIARYNLGLSLFQLGRIEEAIGHLEATLELEPDFPPAHHNLAMLCLLLGRYEKGWFHYQWRDTRQTMEQASRGWQPATPPLPPDLEGKWVSLTGEQGIGDELFFLRFVRELKARGARIAYRPNSSKLKFLFEQMHFLDMVIEPSQLVEEGAVYNGLIGDLPYLLGMKQASEAPPPVVIHPDQVRTAAFYMQWLQDLPPPYIGVCWRAGTQQSRQDHDYDEKYQKLFKELTVDTIVEALKDIPATFVILQRNPAPGEVERFSAGVGRPVLDCSDLNDDLPEMISALACLDDMVGVSNTNYHLRAGLGLKGRTLVPKHPEFRWMARGEASPWFPGFKVYREDMKAGWGPALAALRLDLEAQIAPHDESQGEQSTVYSRTNPSPRYSELQTLYRNMHEEGEKFLGIPPEQVFPGQSLPPQAPRIKRLIDLTGARTLLDYGSGKGQQYQPMNLKVEGVGSFEGVLHYWGMASIHCYDPAYQPFTEIPTGRFDGVISTDVLEHCPEDDIPWIIEEIFSYADKFVFANVACYPAKKRLANGENAHCTIKPPEWWAEVIEAVASRHPGVRWEFWIQFRQGEQLVEKRLGST